MKAEFFNGDILKKVPVEQNERIMLGNSQCRAFLYDSSTHQYQELKDYDMAKTAQRKYIVMGEKRSYREVYFIYTGSNKVVLRFDGKPQCNSKGYWISKRYELELKIKVVLPIKVIQQDIRNINEFISSYKSEIRALVRKKTTGGELRDALNESFKTKGICLEYVSVRTEETTSGLTEQQLENNKRLDKEVEEHHKNQLADIQGNGRRDQQKKDALNQLDIDKQKLTLEYTEKQVILNMMFSSLQRLNIRSQDKAKGLALFAALLGAEIPPHLARLLDKSKRKQGRPLVNLP